ncbi:MAG TPA: hypothetical protein VF590_09960, partial [Isosphaeraceae bacterium]
MRTFRSALLIAAIPLPCLGAEPTAIRVEVTSQTDFIRLAPAGDPPTFSVLRIPRVIDPETGRPYDRSNRVLNCDPARLRRMFRLETSEVLLGEPVLIEFRIELDGPGRWDEGIGGNYRGLGRDGNFFFLMRHQDGAWVPDIFEGHGLSSFGGLGGSYTVKRGKPQSHWLAVQQWCAIDRPGVYDLYAFHWGGGTRTVGLRQCVEAALTDEMRKRVQVDEDGQLVERETGERPRDLLVQQTWTGPALPDVSPIAGLIPDPVTAQLRNSVFASDYAHFTLTVRPGDGQDRRAMVRRWTEQAAKSGLGMMQADRSSAALDALALARQDDFLPELERRLREDSRAELGSVFLGLAMRDNPRAVELLFRAGVPEAIEAMQFLRPSQVA